MNPLCEDRENRHCQLRPFRITILGDDSKGTKMGSSENLGFDEELCSLLPLGWFREIN
ncbi:hypothetical protein Lalb_Chr07g0190731 [Lupinus albus]|uniref:Uncharacterized protein n=1 Tax=Lupinus albus TaxID=3870 RepID=A0A6A4MJ85_LUPAL|nr:hypothetical protein Lalb_Chr00c07g0404721 [Lupinus albus]KAE9610816.1 hypothetical protein Lalb_Chr07g0190731 [Lupinus albus]